MWTLAHAHGTLLGLIHIAYGVTLRASVRPDAGGDADHARPDRREHSASGRVLPRRRTGSTPEDPGIGVALVPVGAVLLLIALFLIARGRS